MSNKNISYPYKGKSLIKFPSDYVIIDLETTGLSPVFDRIIEISAIKVKNNIIVDSFSSLINPECVIDEYISELTGITNEMLVDAPKLITVLSDFLSFIGEHIIVGHNVNFDINFLYHSSIIFFDTPLTNDFVDTLKISRKVLPQLNHHRLSDLCVNFGIPYDGAHRSLVDCELTFKVYNKLCDLIIKEYNELDYFARLHDSYHQHVNLSELTAEDKVFDVSHPLYNKVCVFTGVLEKMSRVDAAQIVVNFGGYCSNSVTRKTNFLILGNNDYCPTIKDGKSTKQKAAEQLKLKGLDIEIITESVFYDMIEDYYEKCDN